MINIDFYTLFKNLLDLRGLNDKKSPAYCLEREECTLNIYFDWSPIFPLIFYRKAWKALEPRLTSRILNPKTKTIIIAGYSHGGVLAQLCYEHAKRIRPEAEVIGVSFGSPRLTRGKEFIFVQNGHDFMTYLSPIRSEKIYQIGRPWGLEHFLASVKKNGLRKAILNFDWIGPLQDHQAWRYEQALFLRFLFYCSRGHR